MNYLVLGKNYDAPGRTRTSDTRFRKPLLYPLSYEGRKVRLSDPFGLEGIGR
jgi:hypothetical protein